MSQEINVLSLLSAKQIGQLNAHKDADKNTRLFMALNTGGKFGAVVKSIENQSIIAEALNGFKKSGCTNASGIARMLSVLAGQWQDSGKLPQCSPKLADVLAYPEAVRVWADSMTNEKIRASRHDKQRAIAEIVMGVRAAIDDKKAEAKTEAKPEAAKQTKQTKTKQAATA